MFKKILNFLQQFIVAVFLLLLVRLFDVDFWYNFLYSKDLFLKEINILQKMSLTIAVIFIIILVVKLIIKTKK